MILPLNELLQSFSSGMIGVHRPFLDVYTDMAFFLPDEHIQSFDEPASCLHTALKQFLYIGCIKWLSFGNQRLIGRLNGKQKIFQPPINFYRLALLPSILLSREFHKSGLQESLQLNWAMERPMVIRPIIGAFPDLSSPLFLR